MLVTNGLVDYNCGMKRNCLLIASIALVVLCPAGSAVAQKDKGEIQKPTGSWQKPGEIRKPGEIQKPTGPWQKPGDIQVPKGIQAISTTRQKCQQRMTVGADALFEFDKSSLSGDSEETLGALAPMIQKAGKHPIVIEGHTDGKGTDAYNRVLSLKRAEAVQTWLVDHQVVSREQTSVKAF